MILVLMPGMEPQPMMYGLAPIHPMADEMYRQARIRHLHHKVLNDELPDQMVATILTISMHGWKPDHPTISPH